MRGAGEARVVERAQRDPAFRERLLADPEAAVAEELGEALPKGVKIRVVEERLGEAVLVLPALLPVGALDDEALAGLAGAYANTMQVTICICTFVERGCPTL